MQLATLNLMLWKVGHCCKASSSRPAVGLQYKDALELKGPSLQGIPGHIDGTPSGLS